MKSCRHHGIEVVVFGVVAKKCLAGEVVVEFDPAPGLDKVAVSPLDAVVLDREVPPLVNVSVM
jgi:hypothetical protein